jgi:hypothetical protein
MENAFHTKIQIIQKRFNKNSKQVFRNDDHVRFQLILDSPSEYFICRHRTSTPVVRFSELSSEAHAMFYNQIFQPRLLKTFLAD